MTDAARRGFLIHLAVYLAVNALLVFIILLVTPGRVWFVWPLAGWGAAPRPTPPRPSARGPRGVDPRPPGPVAVG